MVIKKLLAAKKKYLLTGWILLILISTLTPLPNIPSSKIGYSDKIVHVVLFGIFAFLFYLNRFPSPKKYQSFYVSLFAATFFAALVEILQFYVPGRSCDFFDFLAGSMGSLVLLVYLLIKKPKLFQKGKF